MREQRRMAMIAAVAVLCAGGLLFSRLGTSALWDDEATTALFAQSVWQNGDTDAVVGHNLIAYQSGAELRDLKNRVIPPLAFYLAAPFVGMAPGSAWAARFPFALCGLATVGVVLLWLWQARARLLTTVLMTAGLLTNVSFLLYSRQCRYYGAVILLSAVIAYAYYFRDRGRGYLVGMALAAVLLLSANYLCYAGVMACLAADYFLWGRKDRSYRAADKLIFCAVQLVLGGILLAVYNPLGVDIWGMPRNAWWTEKLTLFGWHWRELNCNEFGVGVLIAMAAVLGLTQSHRDARRAVTALVIYVTVITLLTPQPVNLLSVAFVRYLVPVIPLCVWISVLCVEYIAGRSRWLAGVVAVLAFGTNILHGGPLVGTDNRTVFSAVIAHGEVRSTILKFAGELIDPPPSAYRETAEWINSHVDAGQSVWVAPGYATYPLMYHAPRAVYAWQLERGDAQFAGLPAIHFYGEQDPDYIVAFGPYRDRARMIMAEREGPGRSYGPAATVGRYWYDLTRPELFWHAFEEVRNFSAEQQAVYIYRKKDL